MAGPIPNVPTNLVASPGNGSVYLQWSPVVGSTAYYVLRSQDSVNYAQILSTSSTTLYDTTASTGTLYYYEVQSANGNGTSNASAAVSATPVNYGQVSLGQIRLSAQQRADMVNSGFITNAEWNSYINSSYTELYDILVQTYADEYYVATPYSFTTTSVNPPLYALPVDFYKLLGVDLALQSSTNAWLTLKKFTFQSRNRYVYSNNSLSALAVFNLRYRIVGNQIELVPLPASNQTVRLWYVPRPRTLLADSDILDGVSGWDEYIIVDAAIKALQKEESDVQVLMAQKAQLLHRIEAVSSNRDAGEPECASDVRGLYSPGPLGDAPSGGM